MSKPTTEERIDFLNKHYSFPTRMAFYLGNTDGRMRILANEYKNIKKDLTSIRLIELQHIPEANCNMAILDIHEVSGAEEFIEISDSYRKQWNIAA